jgi:hypothetical protein
VRRAAVLLSLCLAAAAHAEDVRVEPRLLVKQHHLFASLGPTWLDRDDYYASPGLALSLAWYPIESGGVELRFARFFSSLTSSAQEVYDLVGLAPDAHRPVGLAQAGWRQSLTYGKVSVAGAAIHFDVQAAFDAGLLFTDRATAPAFGASVGLLARMTRRIFAQLDLGALASFEQRQRAHAALGFMPMLSMGAEL